MAVSIETDLGKIKFDPEVRARCEVLMISVTNRKRHTMVKLR